MIQPLYSQLGRTIVRHRARSGMTQLDLAKKVRKARTSVANIERGEQRILLHDVSIFAKALSTTPAKLMIGLFPKKQ